MDGVIMAGVGIIAGAGFGYVLAQLARSYLAYAIMPGVWPAAASAFILLVVAIAASLLPAGRAARINVIEALRSE